VWAGFLGGPSGDILGKVALLREAHGLLSALEGREGRFTEKQESEMATVELDLGIFLWTAGRVAEGEPLLRSVLRRRSSSVSERVRAREYLADSALQRGEVDEAERLCDEALALLGESPDARKFAGLHDPVRAWAMYHVRALALRGSVEECRGDLVGAKSYDERAWEVMSMYGGPTPVDSLRRCVLRMLEDAIDPETVAAQVTTVTGAYVQWSGDHGLALFQRRTDEAWARALRDIAAALRSRVHCLGEAVLQDAEAMEGEAAEIEGIFDALKAAALTEARAAVAQERASRQQRRAAEGALPHEQPQLPASPAKLTKSQRKRARQKAARAAFVVAGGERERGEASDKPAAVDASAAVVEGKGEPGEGEEEEEGEAMPPPARDSPSCDGEECALCLDPMATGDPAEAEAVVVGCGHHFHGMCMDMWTATCAAKGLPYTCPLCRHFL
jgi:hypothetical protein